MQWVMKKRSYWEFGELLNPGVKTLIYATDPEGVGGGGGSGCMGHNKFWGSFNTAARGFSHTEGGGGGQTILSREYEKFYLVLKGGTHNLTLIFFIL